MSAVLLSDAKQFLNITSDSQNAEVQAMLNRAEAIIAKHVGPLGVVAVTDEVHTGPGPLLLRNYPILSVLSATRSSLPVTDLDLEPSGILHGTFGLVPRSVKVSYTAGRAFLPPDLEAAVLELLRHLWESQRSGSSLRPAFPGEGDPDTPATSGYLLPYRVQSLIEPYVRSAIA